MPEVVAIVIICLILSLGWGWLERWMAAGREKDRQRARWQKIVIASGRTGATEVLIRRVVRGRVTDTIRIASIPFDDSQWQSKVMDAEVEAEQRIATLEAGQ